MPSPEPRSAATDRQLMLTRKADPGSPFFNFPFIFPAFPVDCRAMTTLAIFNSLLSLSKCRRALLVGFVVLAGTLFTAVTDLSAQACGYVHAKFSITSAVGIVRNAEIDFFDGKDLKARALHGKDLIKWRSEDSSYWLREGMCGGHNNVFVRIRAQGYDELSQAIDLSLNGPIKPHLFRVELRRKGTTENASLEEFSRLVGRIYDAQGSLIPDARLSFTRGDTTFLTRSDPSGYYNVELPFSRYLPANRLFAEASYKVIVKKDGFKERVIDDYIFIPSQSGEMNLDIALAILSISDPVNISGNR
jgi:hypothetical protein